jgi:integrase
MKAGEHALTKTEYCKLLSITETLEDELFLKFAVSTGLRREDLVNILIENIDFDKGILRYYEKKKDMYREIPLHRSVKNLIIKYLRYAKEEEYLFVFCGRTAWNRLYKLCLKAGIQERSLHSLRATCINFCFDAGWGVQEVAEYTNDTIQVIYTYYLSYKSLDLKETIEQRPII